MPALLRVVSVATGEPSEVDGSYVQAYTPDGGEGRGDLVLTRDEDEAKRYESAVDALEDWKRVSSTHPIRPDGRPNRPLTAFSVEVVTLHG